VGWLESIRRSTDATRKGRAFSIQGAEDAREKLRYRAGAGDAEHGVRIWNGRCADSTDQAVEMERDFTTPGTPGRLKCPFVPRGKVVSIKPPSTTDHRGMSTPRSSMSRMSPNGKRSKRSSFHDPIRAEICGQPVSTPPSIEGSVPLCPIRFLDQHSPEEVAQYFEKHKHELPRSHEVCVKRYQANEASIRRLDSKYGNLINMIQGLGVKHQPMLPEVDDEFAVEDEPELATPKDRVTSWAKAVSVSLDPEEHAPDDVVVVDADDERESRFDRSLKDVRVGESPSRPWGITVPARYTGDNVDAASTKSDPTASPLETPLLQQQETPAKAKCPFDPSTMLGAMPSPHGKTSAINPHPAMPSPPRQMPTTQEARVSKQQGPVQHHTQTPSRAQFRPAHTLKGPFRGPFLISDKKTDRNFNVTGPFYGPVLIGYSAEDALALLKQVDMGREVEESG
jgi:hypothetical protein